MKIAETWTPSGDTRHLLGSFQQKCTPQKNELSLLLLLEAGGLCPAHSAEPHEVKVMEAGFGQTEALPH